MQMRDDWTRKNTIPNKSNEFIQQEASFWPATYTLLGVKSMSISAVNTCFWRVKSRKRGCITTPKTYKQLCMNKIQKSLMLGVFTSTRRVDYLHAKYEEARCQEKFLFYASQMPRWRSPAWNESGAFFCSSFEYSSDQNWLTSCRKKKAQEQVYCPWVLLAFTFSVKPYLHSQNSQPNGFSIRLR